MCLFIFSVVISLLYFFAGRYYASCKSDSKCFNDFKDFVGGLNLKDDKVLTGLVGAIYHKLGGKSQTLLSVLRLLVLIAYCHNSGVAAVYGLISLFVQGYQSFDQNQVSGKVDEEVVDTDEEVVEVVVDTDDLSDEASGGLYDEGLVDLDDADSSDLDDDVSGELSDEDVLG